jgi:hypothetical protein
VGNWNDIHEEIIAGEIKRQRESISDQVRRKYLAELQKLTGRNTIAYYSGWLSKPGPQFVTITQISDDDKAGFMSCFRGWDWAKGLDLILHLPGGSIAATETIIDYVRGKFGDNIRTIVPQISMSGGTMLACAGREIVMGLHSNLGPIDPQFGPWPALAILEEFDRACREVGANPNLAAVWQPILSKYQPTLLSQAEHAIKWSREIGKKALVEGMFKGDANADKKANDIIDFLISHDVHHAHGRHVHRKELQDKGLKILELEKDPKLQEAVLSVHHSMMHTLMNSNAVKIIENHSGESLIRNVVPTVQLQQLQPAPVQQVQPPQGAQTQGQQKALGIAVLVVVGIIFIALCAIAVKLWMK